MYKFFRSENKIKSEKILVNFDKSYDIAVIGLGTAGACALIGAASKGLKTIGVEQTNYMGGVGTGGGIHSYYYGSTGGLQAELDKDVLSLSRELVGAQVKGFHPEAKKVVLESKAIALGAELSFSSVVLAVYKEQDQVIGFQLKTASGILNIKTKFVIDCSGEGDFCVLAGANYTYGRKYNGEAQPYSAPRTYVMKDGKINGANFDAGYVDTKDAFAISEAIIKGHALHIREKFTRDDRYVCLSPLLGIREGRFIEGEDTLTFENLVNNRDVNKPVMDIYSHHDTHSSDFAFESKIMQDWVVVCSLWSKDISGGLPLGAFVPKGIKGLLVAGRCMSMDHDASQSFRMQRDMQKAGEIAAVICSLCIRNQTDALQVDYEALIGELKVTGAYPKKWLQLCAPMTDIKEIESNFSGLTNGFALWSCNVADSSIEPTLINWLDSKDRNVSKCAALALGLRGNRKCLPYLRELVQNKDTATFKGSHKMCQIYISAVYLLGQLHDFDSIDLIKNLLICPDVKNFDDVTFSLMALKELSSVPSPHKKSIESFIRQILQTSEIQLPLVMQGNNVGLQKTTTYRGELLKQLAVQS